MGEIRSLESVMGLVEGLLVPVLIYENETVVQRKTKRFSTSYAIGPCVDI